MGHTWVMGQLTDGSWVTGHRIVSSDTHDTVNDTVTLCFRFTRTVRLNRTKQVLLVHGQVTIIFVVSVGLFVCVEFFSAVFDPISIKLGHMLYVWV